MNIVLSVQVPLSSDKTHPELLQQVGWHLERQNKQLITKGTLLLYFQQINPRQSVPNRYQSLHRTQDELQNNLIYMETSYDHQYQAMGILNQGIVFQKKIIQTTNGQVQVIQHKIVGTDKSILQTKQQIVKQHYHLLRARFELYRDGDFIYRIVQVNRPSHVLMVNQVVYWPCLSSSFKIYDTVRSQVFQPAQQTLHSLYQQMLSSPANPFSPSLPIQEIKELFGLSYENLSPWQEVELLVGLINTPP